MNLVVYGADVAGHLARLQQVRGPLQPDGEGVELRPPGIVLAIGLDALGGILLGYGRDDAAVQSAGQEHTVGDVAHQLPADGLLQAYAQGIDVGRVAGDGVVVHPIALPPAMHLGLAAVIVVTGQEGAVVAALPFEGLQLAGHAQGAVGMAADVQGDDTDGVAGYQVLVAYRIVEGKGIDAVELLQHPRPVAVVVAQGLLVEGQYDLAVAARQEGVVGHALPQVAVVVNLAVHGQDACAVLRKEGLASALRVDDGEAFVRQYGRRAAVDAAPVGAAMAYLLRHVQGLLPQHFRWLPYIKYTYYSTHDDIYRFII